MTAIFNYDGPRMLLAEGKNDCHVIASLCNFFKIPETFGLNECGSDELAIKKMSALIAGSEPKEVVGIVVDADAPNLFGKWQIIRERLLKEGYKVPKKPDPKGTILEVEGKPKIGVWLMPDNCIDGMIEDFCKKLASQEALVYAACCTANARIKGLSTFKEPHLSKAVLHTFLAWQDQPGMPMGQAITAKALNPEEKYAIKFKDFLINLFA